MKTDMNTADLFNLGNCRNHICKNYEIVSKLAHLAKKESIVDLKFPDHKLDDITENINLNYFKRVVETDSLSYSNDRSKAYYNTRFVDRNNNTIYGMLNLIKCPYTRKEKYCLKDFVSAQDLIRNGISLPQIACFNTEPTPVFDPSRNIDLKFSHILDWKHRERLPMWLRNESDHALRRHYQDAVQRLRNTKKDEFIPGRRWYLGKPQLLLPLNFISSNFMTAHLALVVDPIDEGKYLGFTVLKVEWAFEDTRLFGPVKARWLKSFYLDSNYTRGQAACESLAV